MSLSGAPEVRAVLTSPGPFHEVEHLARTGSTNDVARERLAAGAEPGLVVVADRQTAGRGRAGRSWTDDVDGPDGPANLAVTATVPTPRSRASLLPLAAGLAVADAFGAAGASAALKWPNDVLLAGRKACGILVERFPVGVHDHALIGCGIDVDWRGVGRDVDTSSWTSLAEETGRSIDRGWLLGRLLASLGDRVATVERDPDGLLAAYRQRCATLGRDVSAARPGGMLTGRAIDVDADGCLVVDTGVERVIVSAGDVDHVRSDT